MELSVDQKIKAAIDPLIERIAALQADNQHFKQELAALQASTHPKANHKPPPKPSFDHGERPQTAKINRKEPQHPEVKPDPRAHHKPGQKKEETKPQHEEAKVQGTKPVVPKTGTSGVKVNPPTATNKDGIDAKGPKPKPTTATGPKPPTGTNNPKGTVNDKKPPTHKNNQGEAEKKDQAQQDKKHASTQKQHKTNSTHGIKSPGTNKPKPIEKPGDKKPTVPPSPVPTNKKQPPVTVKPEPKPLKGGKPKPAPQPQQKVQEKKQPIQAQVNDELKAETQNPPPNEHQDPNNVKQTAQPIPQVVVPKEQVTEQPNTQHKQLQQAVEKVEAKVQQTEQSL